MPFFSCLALALAVGLLLSGCHSDTQPATTTKAAPSATAGVVLTNSPGASYRIYQGILPGSPDTLTLHLVQLPHQSKGFGTNDLVASYHRADGHPYRLFGHSSVAGRSPATADSVLLFDIGPEDDNRMPERPTWRLLRQGRTLTGSHDGQPVRLQEGEPLRSRAFAVRCLTDSISTFPAMAKSPVARVSLQALLPKAPAPALAANILRDMRGDSLSNLPAPQLAQLLAQQRADCQKLYREYGEEARREGYSLSYKQHQVTYVLWNQAPLLSLGFYTYHDEVPVRYGPVATYDTRTGQRLRFADIFRPGTEAQLSKLLDEAVRRVLDIPAEQSLEQRLDVKAMPVTHNVYLTNGGAVFVYAPYEISESSRPFDDEKPLFASQVDLFVPRADLQPLMVPSAAGLSSKTFSTQ